jgi:hypothetical protein
VVWIPSHEQHYAVCWYRGTRHHLFASCEKEDCEFALGCVGLGLPGRSFPQLSAERREVIDRWAQDQWRRHGLPVAPTPTPGFSESAT